MTDTGAARQIFDIAVGDNIGDFAFVFTEVNFTAINSGDTG
jgi:hypothetical protein